MTTLFGYNYYKKISHSDNAHVRLNQLVIQPAYDSASSAARLGISSIVDPVGTMIQQGKQALHAVVNYEQTLDGFQQSIHTLATNDDAKIKFISAQIPFMLLPAAPLARGAGLAEGRLLSMEAKFAEYMRFRGQGFTPAQAKYLMAPYEGMGHHFPVTVATARRWHVPTLLRDSAFNVLSPAGISRGRFYELHYAVDPRFYNANFPHAIGGSWTGARIGLVKLQGIERWVTALPIATKQAGIAIISAAGDIIILLNDN